MDLKEVIAPVGQEKEAGEEEEGQDGVHRDSKKRLEGGDGVRGEEMRVARDSFGWSAFTECVGVRCHDCVAPTVVCRRVVCFATREARHRYFPRTRNEGPPRSAVDVVAVHFLYGIIMRLRVAQFMTIPRRQKLGQKIGLLRMTMTKHPTRARKIVPRG